MVLLLCNGLQLVGRELADGQSCQRPGSIPKIPDEGAIHVVHPSTQHIPNKTRAFADWITQRFFAAP